MTEPIIEASAGLYSFTWQEHGIRMLVDRLHEDSRGVVTAEVLVKNTQGKQIYRGRNNLLSGRSKGDVAKECAKWVTLQHPLTMEALVTFAFSTTIDRYREGEPAVALDRDGASDHLDYRVSPLLQEGMPNLLFGQGGAGKTRLALYVGMMVHGNLLKDDTGLEAEPGNVLYLDYETSREVMERHLRQLERGYGLSVKVPLLYRRCYHPLAQETQELQRIVADANVQLVIVDSVGMACGGEPESAQVAVDYFRALRTIGGTSLSLSHVTKGGEQRAAFGSIYFMNYARSAWELQAKREEGENLLTLGLFHRKVNDGPLHKPLGFTFTFGLEGTKVAKSDPYSDPDLSKGGQLPQRIRATLKHKAFTAKELAQELDARQNSIDQALGRGLKNGSLLQLPNGKWALLEKE